MTKRLFLKLLSAATFGAFVPASVPAPTPKPKQYLTTCTWDELIGLRFMWEGKEWVICGQQVERWIQYDGQWLRNFRNNQYWCHPINDPNHRKIAWFYYERDGDKVNYDRVHLDPDMFYRA